MASKLKIAILWYKLPHYVHACIECLVEEFDVELYISSIAGSPEDVPNFNDKYQIQFHDEANGKVVSRRINNDLLLFKPNVLVASGWGYPIIRNVVQFASNNKILCVCAADTPWLGSLTQIAKIFLGKSYLHKLYDVMWIPGERGMPIARMAGFNGSRLWKGLYSANDDLFSRYTPEKLSNCNSAAKWPKEFIFVGRLVPEKNIAGMVNGYLKYRSTVDCPWPLRCIGDGPLRAMLENTEGIICDGWLSPEQIAKKMVNSGAFVLPSTYEPWGLVVHEACCSGLPLLLSTNVGAGSDLLKENYNGISFDANDSFDLANAFKWISCHPDPQILGSASFALSSMISAKSWANTLVTKSKQLLLNVE